MREGLYNIGTVSKTEFQKKKHFSQMTKREVVFLKTLVDCIEAVKLNIAPHLIHKAYEEIKYEKEDIVEALKDSEIVEFNYINKGGYSDYRILIKSNSLKQILFNKEGKSILAYGRLCLVISLKTFSIVTAYWNFDGDNHKTLNMDRYDKNIDILQLANIA